MNEFYLLLYRRLLQRLRLQTTRIAEEFDILTDGVAGLSTRLDDLGPEIGTNALKIIYLTDPVVMPVTGSVVALSYLLSTGFGSQNFAVIATQLLTNGAWESIVVADKIVGVDSAQIELLLDHVPRANELRIIVATAKGPSP